MSQNIQTIMCKDSSRGTILGGRENKKAQLSLTNPRDACEKFARFT